MINKKQRKGEIEYVLSAKAEARISIVLAAIEQANPNIRDNVYYRVAVRKFYRLPIPIFPTKKVVFLDLIEDPATPRKEINVPEIVSGHAHKKRATGGVLKWCFRMNDMRSRKRGRKIYIKMKGE